MARFWGVKGVFDITEKINEKYFKMKIRVVFMGTPEFSVPTLEALICGNYEVVAVYTQPDRQAGRGLTMVAPPAKEKALYYGIQVLQPETLKEVAVSEYLRKLAPDLIVVAAYGRMLPPQILDLPKLGCINIHPSLLPRYRGSSPVASAILNGDQITGVSIMLLDAGMDSGPVLAQREVPISEDDTTGSLTRVLADTGAQLIVETLALWADNRIAVKPQVEELATYTAAIKKSDGEIDWHLSAVEIDRRVRAFNPWPKCYSFWKGKRLEFDSVLPLPSQEIGQPGKVIYLSGSAPAVVGIETGDGILGLLRIKLEGKREMHAEDFVRGQRDFIGSNLC
jgi:methionyl-tRNA formyltransferase